MSVDLAAQDSADVWRTIRSRHPSLRRSIEADAVMFSRFRGELPQFRTRWDIVRCALRLAWTSDAFLALMLYRLKATLQRREVPILPTIAHRLAIIFGQVSIGDPVVIYGGIYLPHGQVVIDGIVEIGNATVISPFVTIGLRAGNFQGPIIENNVSIGTGAKIIGPVRIGAGATIGAGAVVVDDVPAGATVAGVPAERTHGAHRATGRSRSAERKDRSAQQHPAPQANGERHTQLNGELPSLEQIREEIAALSDQEPSTERAQRLVYLRHVAGIHLLSSANGAKFPQPQDEALNGRGQLPELSPHDLTPGVLRAGILRDGCVLVRGLIPREAALGFAAQIDSAYEERDKHDSGEQHDPYYYDPFTPRAPFKGLEERPWVRQGGGLLTVDSPCLNFEMMRLFREAGLPELVSGYLGESALISAQKSTMRKAEPEVRGAWHQDGSFMGEVRSLNLWLSLSRCGDEAPGLDIVPQRIDHLLPVGTDWAWFTIGNDLVEEAAAEVQSSVIRPIFEPGDALFFDEMFVHQTGSDPDMPNPRFAIENWFFGASGFPAEYAPIAV